MSFKYLDHSADIKFIVHSNSLEGAFSDSILAVSNIIIDINSHSKTSKIKEIILEANNFERLLYELIEEIIFIFETEKFIPKKIKEINIKEKNNSKKIKCKIEMSSIKNKKIKTGIKAMTYHEMKIKKKNKSYIIECVVDI